MNEEIEKRRCVRKRTLNEGSVTRPRKLQIRTTVAVSNEVASIQGLIFKYGHKETLADIFENILLPRLKEYVGPYVDMAKSDREAALKSTEGAWSMNHQCNQFSCPEYNQGQCFGGGCRINPMPEREYDNENETTQEDNK